jgi:hypothetical protein
MKSLRFIDFLLVMAVDRKGRAFDMRSSLPISHLYMGMGLYHGIPKWWTPSDVIPDWSSEITSLGG